MKGSSSPPPKPSPRKSTGDSGSPSKSPKSASSTPRRSTLSPKKGRSNSVKLPGATMDSAKQRRSGSFFNADEESLEGDLSDIPPSHTDPTVASVLDSPSMPTRSPNPPSGPPSPSKRGSGKKQPPSNDMMKDTPTERALKNSMQSNRKVTLRRSYGSMTKSKRRGKSVVSSESKDQAEGTPDASSSSSSEESEDSKDLPSMMRSIVKDINTMGLSDSEEEDHQTEVSDPSDSKDARAKVSNSP